MSTPKKTLKQLLGRAKVAKLRQAVLKARKPGACVYWDRGPCCVIAQLAVLEGVPLEEVRTWNAAGTPMSPTIDQLSIVNRSGAVSKLRKKYRSASDPMPNGINSFLRRLQAEWDSIELNHGPGGGELTLKAARKALMLELDNLLVHS